MRIFIKIISMFSVVATIILIISLGILLGKINKANIETNLNTNLFTLVSIFSGLILIISSSGYLTYATNKYIWMTSDKVNDELDNVRKEKDLWVDKNFKLTKIIVMHQNQLLKLVDKKEEE